MHNHTFCALPSKTFTRMGVLCHCSARQYPEHAQEYGDTLLHTATSSPTPNSFKSLTFVLINTALAEELHCKQENSPHTPVTVLHEILPLPQRAPSKIYPSLSRRGKNNKWESEKAVRSTAKKSELFLRKRPSLRKPANQARSRGCFPRVNRVLIDTAYVCSMQPSTRLSRADRITQTHSL